MAAMGADCGASPHRNFLRRRLLARNDGKTCRAVVDKVLRKGLMTGERPAPVQGAFKVTSAFRGFLPGVDSRWCLTSTFELSGKPVDTGRRHQADCQSEALPDSLKPNQLVDAL